MGNYTIFFRCSKILGEAGKQEILAYENIRFSSLSAPGEVSRETSPAAKSMGKRMFWQATNVPKILRSQIVFRTDIFRKLTLGAPEWWRFKKS